MGNSVTFRLNPKHAEDRAIIEWLDANAGTEGGQTALVKAALLAVIQENNESDYYQKMLKEVQVAISKENEVFAGTVKEVMQAMVNQLFAGSLAMMGQVQSHYRWSNHNNHCRPYLYRKPDAVQRKKI